MGATCSKKKSKTNKKVTFRKPADYDVIAIDVGKCLGGTPCQHAGITFHYHDGGSTCVKSIEDAKSIVEIYQKHSLSVPNHFVKFIDQTI
jgi:hypothetical protein